MIRPPSGASVPVIRLRTLVLPAPFGPTTPSVSPGAQGEGQVVGDDDAAEGPREPSSSSSAAGDRPRPTRSAASARDRLERPRRRDVGLALVADDDEVVREVRALPPLAADERRLGDVRGRVARSTGSCRRSCRGSCALMASRIAALSSTLEARLRTSAATSNSAWAKPIGWVHCLRRRRRVAVGRAPWPTRR